MNSVPQHDDLRTAGDISHYAADPAFYRIPQLFRYLRPVWEHTQPSPQRGRLNEVFDNQYSNEVSVLFTKGHEFAGGEIMSLETPAGVIASVVVANGDRSFLPSSRQNRGVDRQTMNVESKCVVEL